MPTPSERRLIERNSMIALGFTSLEDIQNAALHPDTPDEVYETLISALGQLEEIDTAIAAIYPDAMAVKVGSLELDWLHQYRLLQHRGSRLLSTIANSMESYILYDRYRPERYDRSTPRPMF